MICAAEGCDGPLRRSNRIGYCRAHRNLSPSARERRQRWALAHAEQFRAIRRNWRKANPDKDNAAQRARTKKLTPEQRREKSWRRWGIRLTYAEFERMVARQGGACALCGLVATEPKHLVVDHAHDTGRIRGLLCRYCNLNLGRWGDDEKGILRVLDYVRGTAA